MLKKMKMYEKPLKPPGRLAFHVPLNRNNGIVVDDWTSKFKVPGSQ